MKTYKLIIAFLVFHFQICGQTSIQLILKTDKQIDKVDVFDLSQNETYSSIYKDTLSFHFKKKNIDCYYIRYHEKEKMYRKQIWLDSGDLIIKSHIDNNDLVIDTVINSQIYYKSKDFYTAYSSILKTNDTTNINAFLLKNVEDNLKNTFSYAIAQNFLLLNQNSKLNLINLKSLLDRQGDSFKWFLIYTIVVDRLNNILATDKLKISDFTFFDKHNKKSKLNLKGANYYILDFWFLGCLPCLADHKDIKSNLKKLRNKNIEIIGISTDQAYEYDSWQSYLLKNQYTWQNYMQGNDKSLTKNLGIGIYPTYVIVNNTGEIVESYNLFSDILKKYGLE